MYYNITIDQMVNLNAKEKGVHVFVNVMLHWTNLMIVIIQNKNTSALTTFSQLYGVAWLRG